MVSAFHLIHILLITILETADIERCSQEDMEGMCV